MKVIPGGERQGSGSARSYGAQSIDDAKRNGRVDLAEGSDGKLRNFSLHDGAHVAAQVGGSDDERRRGACSERGERRFRLGGDGAQDIGIERAARSVRDLVE